MCKKTLDVEFEQNLLADLGATLGEAEARVRFQAG